MSQTDYNISVIIPAFNVAHCIQRAIESVLKQTHAVHQIIVVDDCSTDNTLDTITKFAPAVTAIQLKNNSGSAVARNAGLGIVNGNWIAFLDGDDEWLPSKLEQQVAFLDTHPTLNWCCTGFLVGPAPKAIPTEAAGPASGEYDFFAAESKELFHTWTGTILVRSETVAQVGSFDPTLTRHQDWDMWWRLAYASPRIGYLNKILTIQHFEDDTPAVLNKRLQAKKGHFLRSLLNKHLAISASQGHENEFRLLASKLVRNNVLMSVFLGFKQEARLTLRELGELLGPLQKTVLQGLVTIPLSERIMRKSYAMLQTFGIAGKTNRYWDYLRLANQERRKKTEI